MKGLKKIFTLLMIITVLFVFVGCGNDSSKEKNNANKANNGEIENKDIDVDNNGNNNTGNNNDADLTGDIKLISDDTKVVYNYYDMYYMVFYHNGTNITGMEFVYDYKEEELAKAAATTIEATYKEADDVEKVEVHGTKIRVIFDEDAYKDLTLEYIKQAYSNLQEVTK